MPIGKFFALPFFLKNVETSLSRMRLFGYIVVFADDVRDNERTIWHHTHWGRGGPQCEAHARWGRGGLAIAACHCCGPTEGRGGPSLVGPHYHGPARGRGGPSPLSRSYRRAPLSWSRRRKESHRAPLSQSRRRKRRSQPPQPLSWSCWKEGYALSRYRPWYGLHPSFFLKNARDSSHPFSHKRSRFVG
jgi:hypothetical protein